MGPISSAEMQVHRRVFVIFIAMGPPIHGGNGDPHPGRMGAKLWAAFHRRKYVQDFAASWTRCQWGRRFSSAEIVWAVKYCSSGTTLQWGRRFSSAEISCPPAPARSDRSFNGAADFHRRKCRAGHCRTGCAAGLQWGRRFSSAEICLGPVAVHAQPAGFNGAADFHRRKCRDVIIFVRRRQHASMGPPIFIGGNHLGVREKRVGGAASMGPPIFIGGNSTETHSATAAGTASMGPPIFIGGNTRPCTRCTNCCAASMGPPIFIGGNSKSSVTTGSDPRLMPIFIGGNGASWPGVAAATCFNGAADFHRRKYPDGRAEQTCLDRASMGPPIFIGGNNVSHTSATYGP